MLPANRRVRRGEDFARAIRGGQRTGRSTLVAYLATLSEPAVVTGVDEARTGPSRAGFVVSKAVGPAVVRNRVKRRLRHLVAQRLNRFPPNSVLVIRALPASANASHADLARDLDSALARLGAGGADKPRSTRGRR